MSKTQLALKLGAPALMLTTPAIAQTPAKTVNTVQQTARQTTAGAPTLQVFTASAGQSDLCVGEVSGAYGNAMLAVTLDAPKRDKVCSLLRQSKWASDLGEPDLGREIMCGSEEWRAAAARIGRPCLAPSGRVAWWRFW